MSNLAHRRVVTGLNDQGKSCVIIDGPVPVFGDSTAALVWQTKTRPADNSGTADTAEPYGIDMLHTPGSCFTICQFAPHSPAGMHATDTIGLRPLIEGLRNDGVRVLLIEHDVKLVLGLCDRVALMCRGRFGPPRPVEERTEHSLMLAATGAGEA